MYVYGFFVGRFEQGGALAYIFINGLCLKIYEICRRYLALCLLFTHFLSRMEFLWEKELL